MLEVDGDAAPGSRPMIVTKAGRMARSAVAVWVRRRMDMVQSLCGFVGDFLSALWRGLDKELQKRSL